MRRGILAIGWLAIVLGFGSGCRGPASAEANKDAKATPDASTKAAENAMADAGVEANASVRAKAVHPWSAAEGAERIERRFAPPAGFARVGVEEGSFGAFLRELPLSPPGTPVVDHRGRTLYEGHGGIAGVVDIDVGTKDLQQCADAVIRMHAEWRYGRGEREITYRAASGATLSYRAYLSGDRAVLEGGKLVAKRTAPAAVDGHAAYREWLDEVFTWANTASLERDGARVDLADVRPGDFFVAKGTPFGHAVLVLDVAKDDKGKTALLLGQSFMPAQSFHVLRPSRDAVWFVIDKSTTEVATPFWAPFAATALRRLPETDVSRAPPAPLACLARAYAGKPVREGSAWSLLLPDGARIPLDDGKTKTPDERIEAPDVDDVFAIPYAPGPIRAVTKVEEDPGRARIEPLFRATYGATPADVTAALVAVNVRGLSLRVHRKIAEPLRRVAARLDRAAGGDPSLDRFFKTSGGTFNARTIAGTDRASAHSWGIAIDLDPSLSDYWRNSPPGRPLTWTNRVPQPIVDAFEAEGFAWGGRWYHYDTMHFEYRPELFDTACRARSP